MQANARRLTRKAVTQNYPPPTPYGVTPNLSTSQLFEAQEKAKNKTHAVGFQTLEVTFT